MKKLLKRFDKIYLINLDSRTDRLNESIEILKDYDLGESLIRFSAIIPDSTVSNTVDSQGRKISRGAIGLIMSLIEVIKESKEKKYDSILVLEDDFKFLNEEYSEEVCDQLDQLEWDVFYLGANLHKNLDRVDKNIFKLNHAYATHAVAYKSTVFDHILNQYYENKINILDVWLADEIQENFNCYCSWPILSIQRPSYSDIENVFTDYDFMVKNYMKYTSEL